MKAWISKKMFLPCLLALAFFAWPFSSGAAEALAPGAPEPPSGPVLEKVFRDFEARVQKALRDFGIPGMAVAVVQADRVVYARGFGVKEAGRKEPVDPHTVFQVGSTSKAFTAALMASLADEGKVGWKDRVVSHLPGFSMADPWVTKEFQVRDLMAQHSGMKPYAGDILAMLGYSRSDIVRSTAHIAPVTSFRSEFSYVNNLWLTAAALLEAKSGKSWEENLQERILDPLGMTETSCSREGLARAGNRAAFHVLDGKKANPIPEDWPFFDWPYLYAPAGGINSNVLDMAKWVRLQLGEGTFEGKRVLGKENLAATREPQTPLPGGKNAYCLGWLKTDYVPYPLVWHNGATTGSKSLVMLAPELDLGIVILSNLVTPAPEELGRDFVDLYCGTRPVVDHCAAVLDSWRKQQEAGPGSASRPKPAAPPLQPAAYAGSYESSLFGSGQVLARQGKLFFRIGPKSFELALKPWNRDTFLVEAEGFGEEETARVRFDIGADGKAFAFDFQDGDGDLLSRFTKKKQ